MRQLARACVELAIGQALLLVHHRHRVGGSGSLHGEQLRQGGGRNCARGVVPGVQNRMALIRSQNVEATDRVLRLRNRGLEQPNETLGPPL